MHNLRYILESELGVDLEEKPLDVIVKAEQSGVPIPQHLSKIKGLNYHRGAEVYLVEVI